jgi:hypothetical protein
MWKKTFRLNFSTVIGNVSNFPLATVTVVLFGQFCDNFDPFFTVANPANPIVPTA